MCLISSSDLIFMFLSIELQSYGLYILSTMFKDSEYATSAGLTYFYWVDYLYAQLLLYYYLLQNLND